MTETTCVSVNKWVDGWMIKWIEVSLNEWNNMTCIPLNEWMTEWIDGWMPEWLNE